MTARRNTRRATPPAPVPEVARRLGKTFGRPRQRRHGSALDVLVGGVLSQNTSDVNSARAFESLMRRFGDYAAIADAPTNAIAAAIRSGGLARVKAPRLKRMLRQIRDQAPEMDLDRLLAAMSNQQARRYLTSIKGVGIKTASVVLLFAMRRRVFPVDTHVHRVSKRLGLIPAGVSREKAHAELEAIIPPPQRYALHINLIRHGRETCRAQRPACPVCVLKDICPGALRVTRS